SILERIVRHFWLRKGFALSALFVLGFGLALVLLSYDPADPPEAAVTPARATPANLLGLPGAWLAQTVISALGQTAYLALAAWFGVLLAILQKRPIWSKTTRVLGWVLLIPCAAAWAEIGAMPAIFFPGASPGGSLGESIDGFLRGQYAPRIEMWIL